MSRVTPTELHVTICKNMSSRKITGMCGVDICGVYSVVAVQSVGNVRLYEKNTMRNIGCKKNSYEITQKN